MRSISRFLDPADAIAATEAGEVSVLDSRAMGSCWLADRLWQRLQVGEAIVAAGDGRRLEAEVVERTIFAMVANRLSVKPLSKLAGCGWVAERAFVQGLGEVCDDACYRAMDFLHAALPGLQERVFFSVASLLDLEVDLLLFDTTSTYWQTDRLPDELQDAADEADDADDAQADGERVLGTTAPTWRRSWSGWPSRRRGIAVRVWTFPANSSDQVIIGKVREDLRAWTSPG